MEFDFSSVLTQMLAVEEPAPLALDIRLRLSVMNFLEFAIWGAWFVVLGQYLNTLKFTGKQIGSVYATMALGSIFSPMIVGSITDRFFAAESVLGVSHLIGAVLLFAMSRIRTFPKFYFTALIYALVYSPTLSGSNAVIFGNIPDATRDFPTIRVLGTIGWIAANLAQKLYLKPGEPMNNKPLVLASAFSAMLGVFSFFLPHTPPPANPDPFPFLKAVELLKDPSFATFFGISFLITIALAFYYSFTSLFLEQKIKVQPGNVGPLMTIGQWSEIVFLLALPFFLDKLGMKGVLVVGMAAWGLRYALFAAGGPFPLILLGLALHGICYDFFFAAGFILVEKTAPEAIRNSGQALFGSLTYGLGMYLGNEASGWVNQFATIEVTDPATGQTRRETDWRRFWALPCVGVLVALVLFALLYR
ncbi:MAG: MFS transporter [Planctomycetota bacterium]|nr:MFS transporter [Planctomycetota bacterium]